MNEVLISSIFNLIFIQAINSLIENNPILGLVFIWVAVAFEFFEIRNRLAEISLRREPVFWICCSFLAYKLPTAFISSFYNCFSLDVDLSKPFSEACFLTQKSLACFLIPHCPIRLYVV